MSTGEQLIKARLEMLGLAVELQNVALACRRAGVSRSHFYEIKDAFDKRGAEGLAPRPRQKPRMPNQTPPELEARILEMTERYPTLSYVKISHHLTMSGVGALPSAVRYVWRRHGVTVRHQRLHWVERRRAERGGMLTEPQMELPRPCQGSQTDLKQQAEAPRPATMPTNAKTTQAVRKAVWVMSRLRTLPPEHFYRAVLLLASGGKVTLVAKWLLDQPELGGLQSVTFETFRKYLTPIHKELKEWRRVPRLDSIPAVFREAQAWLTKPES